MAKKISANGKTSVREKTNLKKTSAAKPIKAKPPATKKTPAAKTASKKTLANKPEVSTEAKRPRPATADKPRRGSPAPRTPRAAPMLNHKQALIQRREVMKTQALVLIERGNTWRQVDRELRRMFGVSRATAQRVVSLARNSLAQEVSSSVVVARGTSYARYLAIFRDKKCDNSVKVKILERIDKLLGTESPQRVAIGPDADLCAQRDAIGKLDDETLAKLAAAYDELEAVGGDVGDVAGVVAEVEANVVTEPVAIGDVLDDDVLAGDVLADLIP